MSGAQPLLLHSLVEFEELIHGCLADAGAKTLLEIGSESGGHTVRLLGEIEGDMWCVEPLPTRELVDLDEADPRFHLVRGLSPAALSEIPACDAYVIDGDHNYWTVTRELAHVAEAAEGHHPLVILHDVAWPWGRRDLYYDPAALPPEGLHPHSWDRGPILGEPDLSRAGFRGKGAFAAAEAEGGPANGVRTAAEDHVAEREGLRLAVVPAIFGLGVLWDQAAPYADALATRLGPLDANPSLERMERNRLELYLAVLASQRDSAEQGLRQGRLLNEYDSALAAAETDAAALREQVARLRAEKNERDAAAQIT